MVGFAAGSRVEVPGENSFIREDNGDDGDNDINNSNFIAIIVDVTVVLENRMLRRNCDPLKRS
jgi:hypothetical protein